MSFCPFFISYIVQNGNLSHYYLRENLLDHYLMYVGRHSSYGPKEPYLILTLLQYAYKYFTKTYKFFRFTGCTFIRKTSLFSAEPFTIAAERQMGELSLTKSYRPPELGKRCKIAIDFDNQYCIIELMKVNFFSLYILGSRNYRCGHPKPPLTT